MHQKTLYVNTNSIDYNVNKYNFDYRFCWTIVLNNFSEISVRYSKALLELAKEKSLLSKIESDFLLLEKLLENSDVQHLIKTSNLPVKTQSSSFNKILKKMNVQKLTSNFILVLIKNRKINFLNEIIKSFFFHVEKENGVLNVDVITATKLDLNGEKTITKSINKITSNKKIILNKILDKSIIGGLIIKFGSTMIDSSIKTKLNQLKIKMKDV